MSWHHVDYLVYSRQREVVFGACFVKIYEIYTRPPLLVQFNN